MMSEGEDDEDDDASVHSAVSNLSDFQEDEDVDYLALELLHHLPSEKADKLVKSLRAKEKAVQDLLHRNRTLLNSCNLLDEENQALTDRLKDADEAAAAAKASQPVATPAPAPEPAKPSAEVDISVFQMMEKGKEEKILRLTAENQRMAHQVYRLNEAGQQLEEALLQTRKELKKAQTGPVKQERRVEEVQIRVDPSTLTEEERLCRELQGESIGDVVMQKFQQKQAENRVKIQSALQALLKEDIGRIERWGSDVKCVLLAVDSMEAQLKQQLKEPKSKRSKEPKVDGKLLSSGEISIASAQLLDDFDLLRDQMESFQKDQLSLEQTARAAFDGAEPAAAALDADSGMAQAESEAEWIREHNAAWVERVQSVSLKPMLDVLQRTEFAVSALLSSAPPGLIPDGVDSCLRETRQHISELAGQLEVQGKSIDQLQEESVTLGRRVRALQAAQKSHRAELRRKVSEEMERTPKSFEAPLERMRLCLRQQSEVLAKSRAKTCSVLEDLAAAARRSATAQAATPAGSHGGGQLAPSAELQDFIVGELREVRGMGKALVGNLEEGCKAVQARMQQVLEVLVGEPSSGSTKGRPWAASITAAGEEASGGGAEAKKKRGKKKSTGAGYASVSPEKGREEGEKSEPVASTSKSSAADEAAESGVKSMPEKGNEDADLRAEFQEACSSPPEQRGGRKKEKEPSSPLRTPLAGTDLLQELKSLKSDSEALEARMADRLQARALGGALPGVDGTDGSVAKLSAAAKASRRKKMYV